MKSRRPAPCGTLTGRACHRFSHCLHLPHEYRISHARRPSQRPQIFQRARHHHDDPSVFSPEFSRPRTTQKSTANTQFNISPHTPPAPPAEAPSIILKNSYWPGTPGKFPVGAPYISYGHGFVRFYRHLADYSANHNKLHTVFEYFHWSGTSASRHQVTCGLTRGFLCLPNTNSYPC